MDRLISCEFNMDNACVELKFLDGSMISIDTIAVENEVADNMYQRSELDYLIYNDPIGYAGQNAGCAVLPYHTLGESKYEMLGKAYTMGYEIKSLPRDEAEVFRQVVLSHGLNCVVGG